MRYLVAFGIFVVTCVCSCKPTGHSENNNLVIVSSTDPLLTRQASGLLLYKKVPFTGVVEIRFDNDSLKSTTEYLNGMKHGNQTEYHPNGAMHYLRPYKNGEKHGDHLGWYDNGSKKYEYHFVNGLSEGNHKEWYADGQIYQNRNYSNGRALGTQQVWRADGKLRSNYVVRENGRKYGLVGLKRCKNIDAENEALKVLKSTP